MEETVITGNLQNPEAAGNIGKLQNPGENKDMTKLRGADDTNSRVTDGGELTEKIRQAFDIKPVDLRSYSPLGLAFIGDGIYDLMIRTLVMEQGNRPANMLNKHKVHYVNAAAQAKIMDSIEELLTPEEADVYHRGRNAKAYTSAKNQTMIDYKKATGLEALCGYLYLGGHTDRILELVRIGIERTGLQESEKKIKHLKSR